MSSRAAVLLLAACRAPVVAPPKPVVVAAPEPVLADGSITPALALVVWSGVLVDSAVAAPDPVDTVLAGGVVQTKDPECESDPPDYEKENSRYFSCRESSNNQDWTASGVSRVALPAAAAWKGRAVAVYGPAGVLCNGTTAGDSDLIGAWRATSDGVVTGIDPGDTAEIARAVLVHNAALVTSLDAPCLDRGVVVRDRALPPLAMWSMRAAGKDVTALVIAAIAESQGETPVDDLKVVVARPSSGRGHVLVIASLPMQSCNGDPTIGGIWELTDTELRQLALTTTAHADGQFTPRLVADSDGNGWPEIVTSTGIHVGSEDAYAYTSWLHFDDVFDGPWCGD